MLKILTIFGFRVKTNKNKEVFIRKRLFHNGYQISSISRYLDNSTEDEIFTLITEVETFELLQKWLRKN